MKHTEPCIVLDVVRHGHDLVAQAFQLFDGAQRDSRSRLLMHRVDHDVMVVKGEDPVGLVAVGEEASRDGLTDDKRDYRMSLHASRCVRGCGRRSGQEYRRCFFTAAISLTLYIDECHDRALFLARSQRNRLPDAARQPIGFLQTDLALARTGKASSAVWYHANKTCRLLTQFCIC